MVAVNELPYSPPLAKIDKPERPKQALITTADAARIKSALDAIPNSGDEQLSYDEWRNVMFAIHFELGDDGLVLAHEFSAKAAVYDADFLDNRVWPYIHSERDQAITGATIFARAHRHGWQDPAVLDMFEVLPDDPAVRARFAAVPLGEFKAGKPPVWLVDQVLPQTDLAVIFGESGSGKSFFALDLAMAVARGVSWRGRATRKGRVVFICAEGAHGFRNRLNAYLRHHNIDEREVDLWVIPDAPDLLNKADVSDLLKALKVLGPLALVICDTLARMTVGANENSGEDMGRAIGHCGAINRATGAMVALVHHAGKDSSKGARGWSGLRAAADTEIEIVRVDNDRVATVSKQKDGEDGAAFGFRLLPVPVGANEDGDVVTSCVVEHTDKTVVKAKRKGNVERLVLGVIQDALGVGDGLISVVETVDKTIEQMPFDAAPGRRDRRRDVVLKALERLQERDLVKVSGANLSLTNL